MGQKSKKILTDWTAPVVVSGTPTTVLSGWAAGNRYQSANSTGPQANTTGFTIYAVFIPNTNTANQLIIGKSNSLTSTQGYNLGMVSGGCGFIVNNISSPKIGFSDLEVGKKCIIHGVVRAGSIFFYKNGVPLVGSTAIAAYTDSGFGVSIGSFSGGTPFLSGIISAGICSSTGLSDAQVEAHYQALLADPYALPPSVTQAWRGIDAGTTWVDTVGGLSCALNGTVSKTTVSLNNYTRYDYRSTVSDTIALSPILPDVAGGLKIMPIGDSRTLGVGGVGQTAWRQGLYTLIIGSGDFTNIDFVGPNGSTATDPEHDGNTGWTSFDHNNGLAGKPTALQAMATYNPQIVTVFLGVNSAASDAAMSTERTNYMSLIRSLYAFNNDLRIIVWEEIESSDPLSLGRLWAHNAWFLNTAWPTLKSEGIKLVFAKMHGSLNHASGDFSDAVHPNDPGYGKMVPNIYPVFRLATGRT